MEKLISLIIPSAIQIALEVFFAFMAFLLLSHRLLWKKKAKKRQDDEDGEDPPNLFGPGPHMGQGF
jgi:hypothetical protein